MYFSGGIADSDCAYCDTVAWSVRLSVCHTHASAAKVVGRNETPFGSDTHWATSNTALDTGAGPPTGTAGSDVEPTVNIALHAVDQAKYVARIDDDVECLWAVFLYLIRFLLCDHFGIIHGDMLHRC